MDTGKLKADLKQDEGERLTVYDDATGEPIVSGSTVKGHPTIGVGRNLTSARGITQDECDKLLDDDIHLVTGELEKQFPWWSSLSDGRQRALANMCFNLGMPTLKQFKNMLAALEKGDYDAAAKEALDSKWARQVGQRAQKIAQLIREG